MLNIGVVYSVMRPKPAWFAWLRWREAEANAISRTMWLSSSLRGWFNYRLEVYVGGLLSTWSYWIDYAGNVRMNNVLKILQHDLCHVSNKLAIVLCFLMITHTASKQDTLIEQQHGFGWMTNIITFVRHYIRDFKF